MGGYNQGAFSSGVFGAGGTTIPGVGVLSTNAGTTKSLGLVFQALVLQMLGIDADPTSPTYDKFAYDRVRIEFSPQGQPGWLHTEDVAFIALYEETDPYNLIRDVEVVPNDATTFLRRTTYTRVWRAEFEFWGPDSGVAAAQVKSLMFYDFAHDTLAQSNLYLQTDFATPKRIPDNFVNKWWERWDFEVQMNEFVTETMVLQSIGSVEVVIGDGTTTFFDQTVEL